MRIVREEKYAYLRIQMPGLRRRDRGDPENNGRSVADLSQVWRGFEQADLQHEFHTERYRMVCDGLCEKELAAAVRKEVDRFRRRFENFYGKVGNEKQKPVE